MNKGFQVVAVVKVFFPRRQLKVGCPETAYCEDMFTSAPNQTFNRTPASIGSHHYPF